MTIARLRIFYHTSTLDHNEKLYLFAVDFQIIILAVMVKLVTMVMLMTLVIKMMTMTL